MAKVFIYNQDKQITDEFDSQDYTLDQFLALLVERTDKAGEIPLRIDECFDSSNTYFTVGFLPNILRTGGPGFPEPSEEEKLKYSLNKKQ